LESAETDPELPFKPRQPLRRLREASGRSRCHVRKAFAGHPACV